MKDKYDDSIIKDPTQYDRLEVHGARDISDPDEDGTYCEVDDDNPQFYSVYIHIKGDVHEVIGDFSERQDAVDYAYEVMKKYGFNWPIYDHTIPQN